MIEWTDKTIEYFKDASEYTGFHRNLAEKIRPYLKPDWTLCDLGCGLGLLDIELSDSVSKITAIDHSKKAINDLNDRAKAQAIKNIHAKVGDVDKIKDEKWGVLLMSFYGGSDELDRLFSLAKHKVIMVCFSDDDIKNKAKKSSKKNKSTTESKEKYLKSKGYPYKKIENIMEFGQPFKSMDDAYDFFDVYLTEEDPHKRKAIIEKDLKGIAPANLDKEFPYFKSIKKKIGILIVDI